MSRRRALIVGCSIAGPSTAYWLHRAGFTVTVIERFPSLRRGGQAVDIRTCGVSAMRKIHGMEALVREHSTQEEGVAFVRDDGTPFGVIRATGNAERQSLVSEFEIFRGSLSEVLVGLTEKQEGVEYVFGEQIASLQDSEDGVEVEFANGTATATYDLVVACDGATSRTRAMEFECGVREHILPTGVWAAYFSIVPDLLHGSKISHGQSAPGGRFMSIGHDPVGGNRVMFMCVNQPHQNLQAFRDASSQGEDALKAFVTEKFRDVGWETSRVLQEMETSRDFYASEVVQVKTPALHKNRVVLVGDAGYAAGPTGGGTSLALAGGYILAGELCKHGGDVAAGLKGYEAQMAPLIKELQKIPPFVGTIMAPQTKWGIWVRNLIFAFVAWTGIAEFLSKYLGAAFADNTAFPIPEYQWVQ
ncbi:FAD/NAD(P)-binding domain-containing protein [Phaeosphaeriaceae sp. SRC1lsM3a]|nr:FAD/NAD(P)-binding domain-containing protein [Stagonospora sp. SRC1lsM3a]